MRAWRRRVFEPVLEPTCPFSVRDSGKPEDLFEGRRGPHYRPKVRLQSQPWHIYSGVIARCILAAATLEGGKTAAKSVMAAVAARIARNSNLTTIAAGRTLMSRPTTLSDGSSAIAREAFAIPDLDREIKRH